MCPEDLFLDDLFIHDGEITDDSKFKLKKNLNKVHKTSQNIIASKSMISMKILIEIQMFLLSKLKNFVLGLIILHQTGFVVSTKCSTQAIGTTLCLA